MPVIKTRVELDRLPVGQTLEVIADDPAAEEDSKNLSRSIGQEIQENYREGGKIHVFIKKIK